MQEKKRKKRNFSTSCPSGSHFLSLWKENIYIFIYIYTRVCEAIYRTIKIDKHFISRVSLGSIEVYRYGVSSFYPFLLDLLVKL